MYKLGDMSKAVMILFDIYSVKRKTEAYVDYEDKMIITDGSVDFVLGDRVVAFGREFEIRIKKDVSDLVNLKTYTAKKV